MSKVSACVTPTMLHHTRQPSPSYKTTITIVQDNQQHSHHNYGPAKNNATTTTQHKIGDNVRQWFAGFAQLIVWTQKTETKLEARSGPKIKFEFSL